jgi:hypothetical protein
MTTTSLDMGLVERFAGQVMGYYTGGMIAYMIDIGHRAGLHERYVRPGSRRSHGRRLRRQPPGGMRAPVTTETTGPRA